MAVQLTAQAGSSPRWLSGDTPDGGTSACLARTVNFIREEIRDSSATPVTYQTWVSTDQGVSCVFAGQQALNIYNLIKNIVT
jgi:hypothetical protein